jgi:hypothetical protein
VVRFRRIQPYSGDRALSRLRMCAPARVGRTGAAGTRSLDSLQPLANRRPYTQRHPPCQYTNLPRTLVADRTPSNLFLEALGLTEPPVDRHLHTKPVCVLHKQPCRSTPFTYSTATVSLVPLIGYVQFTKTRSSRMHLHQAMESSNRAA